MDFLKGAIARARLPPVEAKVTDATDSQPWGPHGQVLAEIARCTTVPDERAQVMGVLWRRLAEERPEQWRCVYKALTVIEYLISNGSEAVLDELRASTRRLSALSSFHYKDPDGKDQGINVRHKSANLVQLLNDRAKIDEVRAKALANRNKYSGVSADEMRSSMGAAAATASAAAADDDEEFRIRDTAPASRNSDGVDGAAAAPKFRVNLNSAPRAAPPGPAPKLQMSLPPPTAGRLAVPPPPPPKPPAAAFQPPPPAVSAPLFDAFGVSSAPPPAQPQATLAAFAAPPPPKLPHAPPPAATATANLLDLFDTPAPPPASASFAAFPAVSLASSAPPAALNDPFAALASLGPIPTTTAAAMPGTAAALGMGLVQPARTAAVDPFGFQGPPPPLFGSSAAPAAPAAGMRPPAPTLGPGMSLGVGRGASAATPARKPATLDETLNASLANLGLSPFASR